MFKKISLLLVAGCALLLFLTAGVTAAADGSEPVTVTLDGSELLFDVQPSIINGRTMVPMRVVFEALGANIHWDGAENVVTAVKGATVIRAAIGSNEMHVNDDRLTMDVAPIIVDGRTLVPVRFISEALGCDVGWDGGTNTVAIKSVKTNLPDKFIADLASNKQKIVYMRHISQYGGKTYAAGFLCQPGWNPIDKVENYIGAFLIANGYVFYTEALGTGDVSAPMYYYPLDGGAAETFVDHSGNWGGRICLCGDRLVYIRYGDYIDEYGDYGMDGIYVIDTKNMAKCKIMGMDVTQDFQIMSYDDEFVYIMVFDNGEVSFKRAAWDGSGASAIKEFANLTKYESGIIYQLFKNETYIDGNYFYGDIKGSYVSKYGFFQDDNTIGINAVPAGSADSGKFIPAEAERIIFVLDGWIYYYDENAVYKINFSDGAAIRLADWNSKAMWAGGCAVIDGMLYFKSYLDVDYEIEFENEALWRVPVNGGAMEFTGTTWFES